MSVEGKVVAITGTSGGIGRAVAEVFTERGALVVGCARRTDKGRVLEDKISAAGGTFTFVTADVTEPQDCARFIDTAVETHGRIDVLVNNAGAAAWAPAAEVSAADFDDIVRANLHSAFHCSQRAIHHMRPRRDGLLLSIASVQGVVAAANSVAYNASKAALIQMTKTYAVEYLDDGIRSNVIVMGGAPTSMAASAVTGVNRIVHGPDAEPDFSQYLPPPLTGTPLREIATALIALSGDDARAITGATIAIDQAQSAGSLYSEGVRLALSGAWPRP